MWLFYIHTQFQKNPKEIFEENVCVLKDRQKDRQTVGWAETDSRMDRTTIELTWAITKDPVK